MHAYIHVCTHIDHTLIPESGRAAGVQEPQVLLAPGPVLVAGEPARRPRGQPIYYMIYYRMLYKIL